jgi:glycerol-3-phosphate acyltransferase PlsY
VTLALAGLVAYVIGSIPFALIAARMRGVDLRAHGSGNLGATNAIRVLGPAVGFTVLFLDLAKGLLAVLLVPKFVGASGATAGVLCAAGAIAGHIWPLFARFRGGKGVATAAGAFLGLAPRGVGLALLAFVVVLLGTRYVSLASMVAAVVLPLALWKTGASAAILWMGVGVATLVLVRHRTNFGRLLAGTENRVPLSKSRKGAS